MAVAIRKLKKQKKYVLKLIIKFDDYKKWLLNNKTILKSQQRFKSKIHNVFTEEIVQIVQMLEKYAKQSCYSI